MTNFLQTAGLKSNKKTCRDQSQKMVKVQGPMTYLSKKKKGQNLGTIP